MINTSSEAFLRRATWGNVITQDYTGTHFQLCINFQALLEAARLEAENGDENMSELVRELEGLVDQDGEDIREQMKQLMEDRNSTLHKLLGKGGN